MSLFLDLASDVDDVLSDPDLNTAVIKLRRRLSVTPGFEVYDDPVETFQVFLLKGVSFTRQTRKSDLDGSLVVIRVDEFTLSPWATIIESAGVPESTETYLTSIETTDEFIVDGRVRQIHQIGRVPAAGPHVAVWQVLAYS